MKGKMSLWNRFPNPMQSFSILSLNVLGGIFCCCCGDCPVHFKWSSSIPGLCALTAISILLPPHLPSCENKKCLQVFSIVTSPLEAKSFLLKNHWPKQFILEEVWKKPVWYGMERFAHKTLWVLIRQSLPSVHHWCIHETSARVWCTGKTQRDGVEREAGAGMGNTCKFHGWFMSMYDKNHYNTVT